MDLLARCSEFTQAKELMSSGIYPYFRAIQGGEATTVQIDGARVVMAGSNNYLGLTHHPHVIERVVKAVEKYGSGCTGSRFLNGTLDIHVELEERFARFLNREAVLTFSTGFQTNVAAISTLVHRGDIIFSDRDNHASIVDGSRFSPGAVRRFKHNDVADLERLLQASEHRGGRLIVVDGVFSMLGDLARLPELVSLKKRYEATLLVDDAHGIGVLGAHGRGTAEHFGMEDDVDVLSGTFSKSFASIGGFVAGKRDTIHYLKHLARPLIFSAAPPAAAVAATLAALDVIEAEPQRRERLWAITRRMKAGLDQLTFDTGATQTPIIPIIVGDQGKTLNFCQALFRRGVFVNPVIHPAVPRGKGLVRTSYMATHTDAELDVVLEMLEKTGRELGVI